MADRYDQHMLDWLIWNYMRGGASMKRAVLDAMVRYIMFS